MKLRRPRRRAESEAIIALIDVVFFLLVFFMLIGRMDATAPFDLVPAISDRGDEMPGGGQTISISAEGELALNGQAVDRADLVTRLAAELSRSPDDLVRVNADRAAEIRQVLTLVDEVEAMGGRNVVLVVTPPDGS